MEELLDKYRAQFGENFPLIVCLSMGDETICEIIQQCLNDNRAYDPDLDPEADY